MVAFALILLYMLLLMHYYLCLAYYLGFIVYAEDVFPFRDLKKIYAEEGVLGTTIKTLPNDLNLVLVFALY